MTRTTSTCAGEVAGSRIGFLAARFWTHARGMLWACKGDDRTDSRAFPGGGDPFGAHARSGARGGGPHGDELRPGGSVIPRGPARKPGRRFRALRADVRGSCAID